MQVNQPGVMLLKTIERSNENGKADMKAQTMWVFTFNIFIAGLIFLTGASSTINEIVTYPAPAGLVTSPEFTLEANGKPVWVEKIGSSKHTKDYALYGGIEMEFLNVANFSFSGNARIVITAPSDIKSFVIRPKNRRIKGKVSGRRLSFTIRGPQKLYVEINGLPHLAIFANPLETSVPAKGDSNVVYFGPGNDNPGQINLRSNQAIYIAGGAVVNANIRGNDVENVKITGRGYLQGNVRISNSQNIEVNGIFVRNTRGWSNTLVDCVNTIYRNVKVFGYEAIYSVDGINPVSCTNFLIDDCFMRCRDDCVAIKSPDYLFNTDSIKVTNCVMVGWANSDGVTIGFELNGGPVQNVHVKNCDILYARGGGRTSGHSAFSIVCDGPAEVKNILFEDIRVEEHVEYKSLEFIVTDGTLYADDPPGSINNVVLKNVTWEKNEKPFVIKGFSGNNKVENITFENCFAGGKPLSSIGDADFRLNSYASDIRFVK